MQLEVAKQFEALWESSDSPPDVFAFLQQHDRSEASDILAILLQDQRRRWQTPQPLRVEDYLARFPSLAIDPDFANAHAAMCRKHLAAYKLPKRVLFVAELPRNTMAPGSTGP